MSEDDNTDWKVFLSTLSADRLRSLWYFNEVRLNRLQYASARERELIATEIEGLEAMQDAIAVQLGGKPPSLWELGEGPEDANG